MCVAQLSFFLFAFDLLVRLALKNYILKLVYITNVARFDFSQSGITKRSNPMLAYTLIHGGLARSNESLSPSISTGWCVWHRLKIYTECFNYHAYRIDWLLEPRLQRVARTWIENCMQAQKWYELPMGEMLQLALDPWDEKGTLIRG